MKRMVELLKMEYGAIEAPEPSRGDVARFFLLIYFVVLLVFLGVLWLMLEVQNTIQQSQLASQESVYLKSADEAMRRTYLSIMSDLQVEAVSPTVKQVCRNPEQQHWQQLGQELKELANAKKRYQQIVFIDVLNEMVVRIENRSGQIISSRQNLDQFLSGRKILANTSQLQPGQIAISSLKNKADPGDPQLTPFIRFSMPLFDEEQRLRGVMSFDYKAELLLEDFRTLMAGSAAKVSLINPVGDWLSTPDSLQLQTVGAHPLASFSQAYPRAWEQLSQQSAGIARFGDNLFVFRQLRPPIDGGTSLGVELTARAEVEGNYPWIMIARVDAQLSQTLAQPNNRIKYGLFVLAAVLAMPFSWLMGRVWATRALWRAAIRESERWLKTIFKGAGVGIALVSLNGRIHQTNQAFRNLLNYSANELLDKNILEFMHPDSEARFVAHIGEMEQGMIEQVKGQSLFMHRDGQTLITQCNLTVIKEPNSGEGVVLLMVDDITERVRAQEQAMVLQEQLSQTGRVSVMGEMAVIVAHELSTPLNAIVNYASGSIMRIQSGQVTAEELLLPMQRISQQAKDAGNIIRRVRSFVSKGKADAQQFQIEEVINDALDLVDRSLKRKEVQLTLSIEPQLPLIEAPKTQLQQVLVNLCLNAAEAMAEAKQSSIRKLQIQVYRDTPGSIMVEVADNGPGVDEQTMEQLFEPFFTTKSTGLGMGLSICNTLVESWGGNIKATRSKRLGGLNFRFNLPCVEEEQAA